MTASKSFSGRYEEDSAAVCETLRVEKSYDLKEHRFCIGDRRVSLFFVDGLVNGEVTERVMAFLMSLSAEDLKKAPDAKTFIQHYVPYLEVDLAGDVTAFSQQIMTGISGLIIDGYQSGVMIELRSYPVRGLDEPENDRVLRGSHDGFVETLQFNAALIRRRIRDPRLIMENMSVGKRSRTDVVLCYMEGIARPEQVNKMRELLKNITIPSLSLAQESLAECLNRGQWYNPFPRVRYTERPDAAVASLSEGRILVMIDNTPAVMIFPTALFDFAQDTNDYYFPPMVGSYLRFVRGAIFCLTLILTPLWYLLVKNPEWIPEWLHFMRIQEMTDVPLIAQLIVVEIVVDMLKLASLNTPTSLSNAFGLIGALILGEFAVSARLFAQEVLLYMAFVAVANFTQPSFELGYAFKLSRLLILILIALFDLWGFIAGLAIVLLLIVTTKTPLGGYLAPLIPFNGKALARLLWRHPINRHNS